MGRILYGVTGDAGGHVSRSLAIAQLLSAHEIVFVGGGRAQDLARHGYTVVPAPVLGGEVSDRGFGVAGAARGALSALAQRRSVIARLTAVIKDYDPDLIVTDYEYFLPLAAARLGRACISVDRQHAVTHCRYRPPGGDWLGRLLSLGEIGYLHGAASHYMVCSFVPMEAIDPSLTEIFPPVLRCQAADIAASEGEHATVYLHRAPLDWVRALLAGRARRYVIYGFDLAREEGNLIFRRNSAEQFLVDLAGCAYAICNGGHNTICEALNYKKPTLCFPTPLFYEQLLNAHLLAETGYGAYYRRDAGAGRALAAFEARLPQFSERVANYAPWGRQIIASRLEELTASRGVA